MSWKSLYQRLKESNLIQSETFCGEPYRSVEKSMGYMWAGGLEVELKTGTRIVFDFWHHFDDDEGGDWYPSEKQLDGAWRAKFVPEENSPTANSCSAAWHTIYVGEHVYISKKGTFSGNRKKKEIKEKIKDGSWEQDPDLWMLL